MHLTFSFSSLHSETSKNLDISRGLHIESTNQIQNHEKPKIHLLSLKLQNNELLTKYLL